MGRLLQFVAIAIAAQAAVRVVNHWLGSGRESPRVGPSDDSVDKVIHRGTMVRDPQCGVHVPKDSAITLRGSGNGPYFCSTQCRDLYVRAN